MPESPRNGNGTWFGAYNVPELVGRRQLLEQLDQLAHETGPHLVMLTGEGGYGKTRLLTAFLERMRADKSLIVADNLIDLYHIENHTATGAALGISRTLGPAHFPRFSQSWSDLEGRIASGRGAGKERQALLETFENELMALTADERVVLAFDTAERLLYSPLDVEDASTQTAEIWDWLNSLLEREPDLTVLVFGRPEIEQIVPAQSSAFELHRLSVSTFTVDESIEYFNAVSRILAENKYVHASERVRHIDRALRLKAYEESGGAPILLALAIDLLLMEGRLPSASSDSLVRRIMESGRVGQTIRTLGRLRKGATAELLAMLLGCSVVEARERMAEVASLSIAKTYKRTPLVDSKESELSLFLHDVVYDLLEERVYSAPDDIPLAVEANSDIEDYYEGELHSIADKLAELYQPIERGGAGFFDKKSMFGLVLERRRFLTEYLFYILRTDLVRGFRQYYRYMRESIYAGDTLLDRELHLVLLEVWRALDPNNNREEIDGLEKRQVQGVSRLRSVAQAWAEERYDDGIAEAEVIRQIVNKNRERMRSTRNILNAWEAYIRASRGEENDFDRSQDLLNEAIEDATKYLDELEISPRSILPETVETVRDADSVLDMRRWRGIAVLGFAQRVQGYLLRLQEDLHGAIQAYQQACKLWQQINIQVEEATTRNDLGRALSDRAQWDDGKDSVYHALHLRHRLGLVRDIALSINTLAILEINEGNFHNAVKFAERARALFGILDSRRERALSSAALAEATRRLATSIMGPADPAAKVEQLGSAIEQARVAASIFQDIDERPRLIHALIEIGCGYRDRLDVRRDDPYGGDDLAFWRHEAEDFLERAITESEKSDNEYRHLDALVDLLWLADVVEDSNSYEEIEQRINHFIYGIEPIQGKPPIELDILNQLNPLLGKRYALEGHRSMRRHLKSDERWRRDPGQDLSDAAHMYLVSMEYHRRFDPERDFRELRRTTTQIHELLRDLRPLEHRYFNEELRKHERHYGLDRSKLGEMMDRRAL